MELMRKKSKQFKQDYPLSFAIDKLDKDILKERDIKKIEEYIQDPNKVVKSYFSILYEESSKSLSSIVG